MNSEITIKQHYNEETYLEELECTIPKVEFDKNFEKALGEVSKSATAAGFRKGHVPQNTVLQNNFQAISNKAIDISIDQALKSIKDLEPRPLEPLSVQNITSEEDGSMKVILTYIPVPSVELTGLDTIKVDQVEPKKTNEEEVANEITNVWFHYQKQKDPEVKKEDFSQDKINDDFFATTDIAKDNPSLKSYDELKVFINDYINDTYVRDAQMAWEKQVQEQVIKQVQFSKVEGLIDKELDRRVDNYKAKFTSIGMDATEYMQKNNVQVEDLKKEWKDAAASEVEFELVLQKYGEDHQIEPNEEEMQENLATLDAQTRAQYNNDEERLRNLIRYYFINQRSYIAIMDIVKANSEQNIQETVQESKPVSKKGKKTNK